MTYDINSPANEQIKRLVRLKDRRQRDDEGVFVVEGWRLYERAKAAGLQPSRTYVSDGRQIADAVTVAPEALDRASYRSKSLGVIGVFPQITTTLGDLQPAGDGPLLVVEAIEKPGNLGAMLRTALSAGAGAVVSVDANVDLHNPNVVRSSTGALFSIPVAVTAWPDLMEWLEGRAQRLVVATPDAETDIWESDLSGTPAILVGAEDSGVSDRARAAASTLVRIPQAVGAVDSLNASVAAAVLLYEAFRQRSHH